MRIVKWMLALLFVMSCHQVESAGKAVIDGYDPEIVATCQAGCGASSDYAAADIKPQRTAKVGDLVRCPISGVVFEIHAESPKIMHENRTYRTCCQSCAGVYANEPHKAIFN